jgi:hypothetical protein
MPRTILNFNTTYTIQIKDLRFGSLPISKIVDFFKDGRTSEILQTYITKHFKNLRETDSCSSFDILDVKTAKKYEVKTLAKRPSVSLYPSSMSGVGRTYNEKNHKKWIKAIDGVIVIDNRNFPLVRFRLIPSEDLIIKNKLVKTLSNSTVTGLMNLKKNESIRKIFNKNSN